MMSQNQNPLRKFLNLALKNVKPEETPPANETIMLALAYYNYERLITLVWASRGSSNPDSDEESCRR